MLALLHDILTRFRNPNLLKVQTRIQTHLKFMQQLLLKLYVDDLSNNFNNVEDSFKFYEVSKKFLAESSFRLHKWVTNNDELAKLLKLNKSDTTDMHNADDETYAKDSLVIGTAIEKFWVLIRTQLPIILYLNLAILSTLLQN